MAGDAKREDGSLLVAGSLYQSHVKSTQSPAHSRYAYLHLCIQWNKELERVVASTSNKLVLPKVEAWQVLVTFQKHLCDAYNPNPESSFTQVCKEREHLAGVIGVNQNSPMFSIVSLNYQGRGIVRVHYRYGNIFHCAYPDILTHDIPMHEFVAAQKKDVDTFTVETPTESRLKDLYSEVALKGVKGIPHSKIPQETTEYSFYDPALMSAVASENLKRNIREHYRAKLNISSTEAEKVADMLSAQLPESSRVDVKSFADLDDAWSKFSSYEFKDEVVGGENSPLRSLHDTASRNSKYRQSYDEYLTYLEGLRQRKGALTESGISSYIELPAALKQYSKARKRWSASREALAARHDIANISGRLLPALRKRIHVMYTQIPVVELLPEDKAQFQELSSADDPGRLDFYAKSELYKLVYAIEQAVNHVVNKDKSEDEQEKILTLTLEQAKYKEHSIPSLADRFNTLVSKYVSESENPDQCSAICQALSSQALSKRDAQVPSLQTRFPISKSGDDQIHNGTDVQLVLVNLQKNKSMLLTSLDQRLRAAKEQVISETLESLDLHEEVAAIRQAYREEALGTWQEDMQIVLERLRLAAFAYLAKKIKGGESNKVKLLEDLRKRYAPIVSSIEQENGKWQIRYKEIRSEQVLSVLNQVCALNPNDWGSGRSYRLLHNSLSVDDNRLSPMPLSLVYDDKKNCYAYCSLHKFDEECVERLTAEVITEHTRDFDERSEQVAELLATHQQLEQTATDLKRRERMFASPKEQRDELEECLSKLQASAKSLHNMQKQLGREDLLEKLRLQYTEEKKAYADLLAAHEEKESPAQQAYERLCSFHEGEFRRVTSENFCSGKRLGNIFNEQKQAYGRAIADIKDNIATYQQLLEDDKAGIPDRTARKSAVDKLLNCDDHDEVNPAISEEQIRSLANNDAIATVGQLRKAYSDAKQEFKKQQNEQTQAAADKKQLIRDKRIQWLSELEPKFKQLITGETEAKPEQYTQEQRVLLEKFNAWKVYVTDNNEIQTRAQLYAHANAVQRVLLDIQQARALADATAEAFADSSLNDRSKGLAGRRLADYVYLGVTNFILPEEAGHNGLDFIKLCDNNEAQKKRLENFQAKIGAASIGAIALADTLRHKVQKALLTIAYSILRVITFGCVRKEFKTDTHKRLISRLGEEMGKINELVSEAGVNRGRRNSSACDNEASVLRVYRDLATTKASCDDVTAQVQVAVRGSDEKTQRSTRAYQRVSRALAVS